MELKMMGKWNYPLEKTSRPGIMGICPSNHGNLFHSASAGDNLHVFLDSGFSLGVEVWLPCSSLLLKEERVTLHLKML